MATHASLKEILESNAVYGAIVGNFVPLSHPMLCVQRRHSIDLYYIFATSPARFVFLLSYPINGKIREIAKIPLTTGDAILVWCEEWKVRNQHS